MLRWNVLFALAASTVPALQPAAASETLDEVWLGASAILMREAPAMGLTAADVEDFVVTDSYTTKHNGVTHVYLLQRLHGIEVANGTMTLNLDGRGNVLSKKSRFVADLANRAVAMEPELEPAVAIRAAAGQLGLTVTGALTLVEELGGIERKAIFSPSGLSLDPIPIHLAYYRTDDDRVHLTWEMVIRQPDQKHWWQLWQDAASGKIVATADWIANDTYEAFRIPLESPLDGTRTIESDPADSTASPFGWHDTDGIAGAEHTVTRGNNVCAQQDRDGDNSPCGAVAQPDGGASLDFSASLDLASQQPVEYQDAAVINLFYWNNIIHDVLYQYGFDETAGNFQENNYGNGGLEEDSVNADAQDGSGTDNANFGTPPDGQRPRMQMFEWLAPPDLMVNSPPGIAGEYATAGASFGARLDAIGITADVELVDDGTDTTSDACETVGSSVSGKIALIDRGTCEFGTKVLNAENAGAVAAIIANNDGDDLVLMGPGVDGGSVTVPSLFVGQTDGATIRSELVGGVNATMLTSRPDRDSDLDNGIIVHEYCHGLSTRLTGGPSKVLCLNQDQQAGEGWSDICTLFFAAEADDRPQDGHGVATYVSFEPSTGPGIRPAPYSADLAVNGLTYGDLTTAGEPDGLSIPHCVGTVFATAAWEVYWNLVDKHGFDPDLYGGTGGNNLWFQLIVDGLKLQPCNPTFLEARDAILEADTVNNGGANHGEIWEGFAKRGMGVSASDGNSGSSLAVTEAFDVPALYCEDVLTIESQTVSGWNEIHRTLNVTIGGNTIFDDTSFTTVNSALITLQGEVTVDGTLRLGNEPRPCT
jgi:hypothetical protein